jgi:hypothetical protein
MPPRNPARWIKRSTTESTEIHGKEKRLEKRLLVEADSIRRLERLGLAARDRERPFAEALTVSR